MPKSLKICLLFLLIPFVLSGQTFQVKVIGISDGDTFTGLNRDSLQLKFRIHAIDAPEKKQAFGTKSKEHLSSLIFGQTVTVHVNSQDGWGRYIATVSNMDRKDVGKEMIKAGLAWHYKQFDNSEEYAQIEKIAQKDKIGLWRDPKPVPPWQFRKK
jgi:endonuclease YncB( thermonuclease family)